MKSKAFVILSQFSVPAACGDAACGDAACGDADWPVTKYFFIQADKVYGTCTNRVCVCVCVRGGGGLLSGVCSDKPRLPINVLAVVTATEPKALVGGECHRMSKKRKFIHFSSFSKL